MDSLTIVIPNPLYGFIGALNGIDIEIAKPDDEFFPRNFFCRNGLCALPLQAAVDRKLRFIYMSGMWCGCTFDAVEFSVSTLAKRLQAEGLLTGYWVAADPDYVRENGLLTLWKKAALRGEHGVYCDSVNFWQSSHRMHVEQALGVLVNRWGILWRPLKFSVPD